MEIDNFLPGGQEVNRPRGAVILVSLPYNKKKLLSMNTQTTKKKIHIERVSCQIYKGMITRLDSSQDKIQFAQNMEKR